MTVSLCVRLRAVVVAFVFLTGAACGPSAGAAAIPVQSAITGPITQVTVGSSGPDDVQRFTVRQAGRNYVVSIAGDVDYGFALGHLQVHKDRQFPVRVFTERRGRLLVALSIQDVPAP